MSLRITILTSELTTILSAPLVPMGSERMVEYAPNRFGASLREIVRQAEQENWVIRIDNG